VLGGSNSKLGELPKARLGDNANAFKGGFRLWEKRVADGVGVVLLLTP
jgi:hypothetical protein